MLVVLGLVAGGCLVCCTMPVPPANPRPSSNSSRRSGLPTIRTNPVCFDGDGTTRSPMFGLDNGTYTIGWRMDSKQIPPDQGILDCTFGVDKINPDADPLGDEYAFNVATYAKVAQFPGNNHRNGFSVLARRYHLRVHESTFCQGAWAIQMYLD
jgi:hypothetical protein